MNDLYGLLPMYPWEGPPLPRFLGVTWASLTSGSFKLEQVFKGPTLEAPATTLYSNLEEIEFPEGFDPETFMPRKIVIHRKAETRNGAQ